MYGLRPHGSTLFLPWQAEIEKSDAHATEKWHIGHLEKLAKEQFVGVYGEPKVSGI